MTDHVTTAGATLLRRIRLLLILFIVGLVISGITAIPLTWELNLLARLLPIPEEGRNSAYGALAHWIHYIRDALVDTDARYPQLAYGTDWLAFAHVVIAVAFIGPLRDPVRNIWVLTFGIIASIMVIPFALIFGALREIPIWWRIIDCAFGILALPLLMLARSWTLRLEGLERKR